ncbi:MAG: hypothetical protein AAF984_08150 [Verrucomicrobiota bacterium]
MTIVGIVTGIILIVLGFIGFFAGGMVSWTAFIPSFFGLPILIGSLVALNPDRLRLGMHVAAFFGLLGFLAPFGRIIPKIAKGEFTLTLATGSMIMMSVVCGIFIVLCIKYFIEARRRRAQAASQ